MSTILAAIAEGTNDDLLCLVVLVFGSRNVRRDVKIRDFVSVCIHGCLYVRVSVCVRVHLCVCAHVHVCMCDCSCIILAHRQEHVLEKYFVEK